jgi:hypothetical protein
MKKFKVNLTLVLTKSLSKTVKANDLEEATKTVLNNAASSE